MINTFPETVTREVDFSSLIDEATGDSTCGFEDFLELLPIIEVFFKISNALIWLGLDTLDNCFRSRC